MTDTGGWALGKSPNDDTNFVLECDEGSITICYDDQPLTGEQVMALVGQIMQEMMGAPVQIHVSTKSEAEFKADALREFSNKLANTPMHAGSLAGEDRIRSISLARKMADDLFPQISRRLDTKQGPMIND